MFYPQHYLLNVNRVYPIFFFMETMTPKVQKLYNKQHEASFEYVRDLKNSILEKCSDAKDNIVTSYHKYRAYFDKKPEPLALHSYCLLLNPILTTQSEFTAISMQTWIPLYGNEKVLTSSNHLIRKVNTNFTQVVHRIRLEQYAPKLTVD